MGIPELQHQISALERGIVSKRANVSQLDARIANLEAARPFAVSARDEAEELARSVSYFALAGWTGTRADAFMQMVSTGGSAQREANGMHARCTELVNAIDHQLNCLRQELSSVRSGITVDQRSISQARASIQRLLKAK